MNKGWVYVIVSPSNRIYVGQTIDVERRKTEYKNLRNCKGQPKLYNSLMKYGWDAHVFKVAEECNKSELNILERFYQDVFDAVGEYGLNCSLTKSTDKSGEHSKETKIKMSEAKKGNTLSEEIKRKISDKHKGKTVSFQTRQKMSAAGKGKTPWNKGKTCEHLHGKKRSDETKKKIGEKRKGKVHSEEAKIKIAFATKFHNAHNSVVKFQELFSEQLNNISNQS